MSYVVPTSAEFPDYEQEVVLGSVTYRLRFTYNSRDAGWYLTVLGAGGDTLVAGQRICLEQPILEQFQGGDFPGGDLIVADPGGERAEPSRDTLRDDALPLVFVPSEELG